MNGELGGAATWWHCLGDASDIIDGDHTLDLLFMDVKDSVVRDGDHALL